MLSGVVLYASNRCHVGKSINKLNTTNRGPASDFMARASNQNDISFAYDAAIKYAVI